MNLFLTRLYLPASDDERAKERRDRRIDATILPLFVVLYYAVGHALAVPGDRPDAPQAFWPGLVNAVFACHALWGQSVVRPVGDKQRHKELWQVQKCLGMWVFLTRNVLCIQAIHSVASFVSPAVANAVAVYVAGMGLFVTIQYFVLVHWNRDFVQVCKHWAERGVPYRELMFYVHLPAGFVGLSDLAFAKPRAPLEASIADYTGIVKTLLAFVAYYMTLIHVNHRLTGEWPYPFMYPLGTSVSKWAVFTAVQSSVLLVFVTGACWLIWYMP
eukprot:TRINITY_DN3128_c0_g3_i1.p1 TRINITY_DN3128_c0_g3~~TRINITY_DN3128_c0_g3_i1.p1  ORF type:complete len:297 (+),score=73.57 TRINITY_DN3128_c0_g3_i1:77-892(+)